MTPSNPASPWPNCHVCGAAALAPLAGYETLHRVTSDCKPWPPGGRLGWCATCGCVQKAVDSAWRTEIARIYAAYTIYHQGAGAEQAVFAPASGCAQSRSTRLLERLGGYGSLPERGRLLDVGCGNGALLRAFHARAPLWKLTGTELDDKHRAEVEHLGGVEQFVVGAPEQATGTFTLITLVHVLEHILQPQPFLAALRRKLRRAGRLLVELPDHAQNPFDLLIADHATHFSTATLIALLRQAGFEPSHVATDWIPKEMSLLADKAALRGKKPALPAADSAGRETVERALWWLASVAARARELAAAGPLGLFGTSIAATWLSGEAGEKVAFYVDEDPRRAGTTFMDRPVYSPAAAPAAVPILIALPSALAHSIRARQGPRAAQYVLPPDYKPPQTLRDRKEIT